MSLFPAYASEKKQEKSLTQSEQLAGEDSTWLKNDSFIGFNRPKDKDNESEIDSSNYSDSSDEEIDKYKETLTDKQESSTKSIQNLHISTKRQHSPPHNDRKKQKVKTTKTDNFNSSLDDLKINLDNLGFIDIDPAPSEAILKKIPSKSKKSKKKLLKLFHKERYFANKSTSTLENLDDEEIRNKTEEFNVKLREDPYNVQLWIQYVRFQDVVIRESRSRADKKLSIVSKAIESNPNSLELTQEMFSVMETFSTPEAIQSEAKKILMKNNKNTVAWQWMINSSLFNITNLSVPNVVEKFSLALESLFRAFPTDSHHVLDVLLQSCIFLRQAGLWEQLWLLVQLSLELNLTTPGSNAFNISTEIDEQKLRDTEDDIIVSGLPLGSLWLRLEYLRSCLHFLPASQTDDDPQRLVFSSDVASLLHPVQSSYTNRLIAVLLTALKVPLIPMSHNGIEFVGLDRISWAMESPELLLAALTHPYLIKTADKSCLKVSNELLVGPQCIVEDRPGFHEMFSCTDSLFERISAVITDVDTKDVIALWRIRWYRLVGYKKCSKHAMKILQAFPHCIPVYTDFALLAAGANDITTCLKVLDKAVKHAGGSPLHAGKDRQKQDLAYLYKTYIELLVTLDLKLYRNRILRLMYRLTTGQGVTEENIDSGVIASIRQRFDAVTKEMIRDFTTGSLDLESSPSFQHIMLPPLQVSWFASHAWFLFIMDSPAAARQHLEETCSELKKIVQSNTTPSLGHLILENCYETLIFLMQCTSLPEFTNNLKTVLRDAAQLYPNNLYILHVASSIDILVGRWWSVSPVFINQSSVFTKLFTIFAYRQKLFNFQGAVSEDEKAACQRKLYDLVRRTVCEGPVEYRRCPLLWRLLLQFVEAQHPSEIKSTFYRALDLCPWVKSIYYDGAKMLPEELGQIQDLIIEKELRIHITCEELEILRQDENQQGTTLSDQSEVH